MNPIKGELQFDVWDKPYEESKEKDIIIETRRWNDERITKSQYWNSTYINTIKKLLSIENNDPSTKISRCGFIKQYPIDKEGGR